MLHERFENALRLARLDKTASELGLYVGQPLAEARALIPKLIAAPLDTMADERDFCQLLKSLFRYSPLVARRGIDVAFLDITGVAHLFGGEKALVHHGLARFNHHAIQVRASIADTPGAAMALARFGIDIISPKKKISSRVQKRKLKRVSPQRPDPHRGGRNPGWRGDLVATQRLSFENQSMANIFIAPPKDHPHLVRPLPVEAMGLSPKTVEGLKTVGLKTIGSVLGQPRSSLVQRFGKSLVRRLDEVTGDAFESLSPIAPPPDLSVQRSVPEPVMTIDVVLEILAGLASEMSDKLLVCGKGARQFDLHLFRLDHSFIEETIRVGAPTRAPDLILRLFRLKFEKGDQPVDPGFGFESFRLSAAGLAPLAAVQQDALKRSGAHTLNVLAAQLANHLGSNAVYRRLPEDTFTPERAERAISVLSGLEADQKASTQNQIAMQGWKTDLAVSAAAKRSAPDRPLVLFERPEPVDALALAPDSPPARFIWRRVSYRIAKASGPERILGEWRLGETFARDYYRLEDENGRRYWVFRDGAMGTENTRWFIHGCFS
ncbi:MAG: DNA polymerase Y family protein [Pseudomonadota bacterium]